MDVNTFGNIAIAVSVIGAAVSVTATTLHVIRERKAMENPNTWKQAEKVILEELSHEQEDFMKGVCGLSLPKRIANRLRAEGLLKEGE